jgi:hypothetical protein
VTVSPTLSLILIGGAAFGGLVCMCLAVAVVAIWNGN